MSRTKSASVSENRITQIIVNNLLPWIMFYVIRSLEAFLPLGSSSLMTYVLKQTRMN